MTGWLLVPIAFPVSLLLTWVVRRYALARGLLDVPNRRSSHERPTPRGGGMAVVVTFLGGVTVLWGAGIVPDRILAAFVGAGGLVALIGFVDDHVRLGRKTRFAAHIAAAAWMVFAIRAQGSHTGSVDFTSAALVTTVLVIYLTWLTNLYNFMDGIDGIASVEAITVCLGGALLFALTLSTGERWLLPAILVAAVAGFLVWNFPPARIFMGDGGSGFLGLALGGLSLQAGSIDLNLFWGWTILLGVFIVDASVTLLRRMARGGRVYLEAHRSHAYQHAARRLKSHRIVCLGVAAINVLWLGPLAVVVAAGKIHALLGVSIAYVPIVILVLHFNAGADRD